MQSQYPTKFTLDSDTQNPQTVSELGFAFPTGYVTVMALLKHDASLHRAMAGASAIIQIIQNDEGLEGSSLNTAEIKQSLAHHLELIRSEAAVTGSYVITCQIDRALAALKGTDVALWMREVQETERRVSDQLKNQIVYIISPAERRHYEDPLADWGDVPRQFPSLLDYIEEAEKAYALGFNTACVFHCMGIMHQGLLALSTDVGKTVNPIVDNWEAIIGAIEGGVKAKQAQLDKADWKIVEPFYEEAVSDLRSVKNAWRNPTMHFSKIYTQEQAAKVRSRVRDLMLHLSTRITEV